MAIDNFTTDRRDYVGSLMGNDDRLACHGTGLVRGGACLHDLLEVRGQVDHVTISSQLRLVCIDLELNIATNCTSL